jgi:peptidyl-prolyl cis-trans isomerase SurA
MKIRKALISSILLATVSFSTIAQTILEVGNQKVSKQDFLKMYEKNSIKGKVDYSESAIKDYLNYYTLYRMKLLEAKDTNLESDPKVKREMEAYKQQLAMSYLKDKTINEKLVKEAYERMKYEIEFAHIYHPFPLNGDFPHSGDSLKKCYQELEAKSLTFEDAVKHFSKDESTKNSGGYVGFISALQTECHIEDVLYKTPVGKYSEPFKSSLGWHIVKVISKRPNQGKVQVQQILINVLPSSPEDKKKESEEKIAKINKAIKEGVSFDKLVSEYSDDKFSKSKNGLLDPFQAGKYSKVFENAAFNLKKVGDIAGPIQTEYGYHFIKLHKKIPLGSYESIKDELFKEVENDLRSYNAHQASEEAIRTKLNFKQNDSELNKFKTLAKEDNAFYLKDEISNLKLSNVLFEVNNQVFTNSDFLAHLRSINNGRALVKNSAEKMLNDIYTSYVNKTINEIRINKLALENEEFKSLLKEYNDAILIFELMSNNVWKKANDDEKGLNDFYEKHKNKYQWEPGFTGLTFQSKIKSDLQKVLSKIDEGVAPSAAYEEVVADPKNAGIQITINNGRVENTKYNITPSILKLNTPSQVFEYNGNYIFVVPQEIYQEKTTKTLDEAKGFVVSDYQEYLEKEWHASMQKKYPVKIYDNVLKTVIKK